MPVSHFSNIDAVLRQTSKVKDVKSILDVGVGFGKYGLLLRERFDVRFKRCIKEEFTTKIDGVEIYEPYITPVHNYLYDKIFIGHIYDLLDIIPNYDIIIMLECLEHMSKSKGIEVVKELWKKTNKLIIFSFPNKFEGYEGHDWPNIYERHRCLWTKSDLDRIIGKTQQLKPTIFTKVKND